MESIAMLPTKKMSQKQFAVLYEKMLANGDERNAIKILELYEKMRNNELVVSFAGHFSAGKSTMINHLLEEEILPESPIPTSANVVKINSGDGAARVYFHHEAPMEYKEPYDIDMIKAYCKDKDTIKKMEISTGRPIVPTNTAIFDTPGIDAADDADRLITEASMHLVDVLFYVMDYNHVQSEVNLQFLQRLYEKGIPFYVCINQIDKHDEKELAFTDFEASIKQTFHQWNIVPEEIYYSSLMDQDAPHNQFPALKKTLFMIMEEEHDQYVSITDAVKRVAQEHEQYLEKQYEEKMAAFPADLTNEDAISNRKQVLNQKIAELKQKEEQMEKEFQTELQTTIRNAYIIPFDIREKAKDFLISQQRDFKVGFIGSKKKTDTEKEQRLQAFLNPLKENMEALIEWKLRDKFAALLKNYHITDSKLAEQTQQITLNYTEVDLKALINPGAKVNGEYVLNYTDTIHNDIKQKYKQQALALWQTITKEVKKEIDEELDAHHTELGQLNHVEDHLQNMAALQWTLETKEKEIQAIIQNPDQQTNLSLDALIAERQPAFVQGDSNAALPKKNKKKQETAEPPEHAHHQMQPLNAVLTNVEKTIQTIEDLPGFQSIVHDLAEKQDRLRNRKYTIALFGAFSAGKSTLANALLGDTVLPVSPNPTTAAINRICPVSEEFSHGTIVVHMKDSDTLYQDLLAIAKPFSPKQDNFHDLLNWVKETGLVSNDKLLQTQQSFIHAMLQGYSENQESIGNKLTLTIHEFPSYVSDETKACFVESINLYYDCEFTRKGITLVDTPGADSVNSRHTNVAFDYIKHADALLYVTYFNHALSRADKDFLMQLGRVKESFQLDKMFFIINACDLAKDNEELSMVTDYVTEQLALLGIRFPRLYPVSGKQALKSKRESGKTGTKMQQFEHAFYQFIHEDLSYLTVQSALIDIKRAEQSVSDYIRSANLNEQEKEAHRSELLTEQKEIHTIISELDGGLYIKQLQQKLDKQLYYVLDRLSIRFHDMFKEKFNPTTVTEAGRKAAGQLNNNMDNLLDYAGYELLQELRAVSLRVESLMHALANDIHVELSQKIQKIDHKLLLRQMDMPELVTAEYTKAFGELDHSDFQKPLAMFKGTKAFFVKNEKEQMKEAIYQIVSPIAEQYLNENKDKMTVNYTEQWKQTVQMIKQKTAKNADNYIEQGLSMLSQQIDMVLLKQKQEILAEIVQTSHK